LHVAAHEAAHQLQEAGAGDRGLGAEAHAHAVAGEVAAGRSARRMLGTGSSLPAAERGYIETDGAGNWGEGVTTQHGCRLSDTGQTLTLGKQVAYAEPDLIKSANAELKAHHSGIEISAGGGAMPVKGMDGSVHMLQQLQMTQVADPSSQQLYDDCGRIAREIMGPTGENKPAYAVTKPGGLPMDVPPVITRKTPKEQLNLTVMIDEKLRKLPGYPNVTEEEKRKAAQEAYTEYAARDESEQKAFVKKNPSFSRERGREMGLDEAAAPDVGEAYSIVRTGKTSYGDAPYHWAAVIMVAGSDRVTLENFGVNENADDAKNAQWYYSTYGMAAGQTFHERWENKFGDDPHTLRMRTQTPLDVNAPTMRTSELITALAKGGDEQTIREEVRKRYASIDLACNVPLDGSSDDVYLTIGGNSGTLVNTGVNGSVTTMAAGTGHIFVFPLRGLGWPLPDPLVVRVYGHHLLREDELIGSFTVPAPYKMKLLKLVNGRADYGVVFSL